MKIERNQIMALSLTLLLALPAITIAMAPAANADETQGLPVEQPKIWRNVWYMFERPLITLIFPKNGAKPMFLWWYTDNPNDVYVVKFQGIVEYLILGKPYYLRRYHADGLTINATLWKDYVEPKMRLRFQGSKYMEMVQNFFMWLYGLHGAFLPFSACEWNLTPPKLVENGDSSYWSFNFTLTRVNGHPRLEFAENNIEIRCRFYNTNTTEIIDQNHNYTVAAGHLKFDFVVNHWEWNIDKINEFLRNHGLEEIPTNRTGLTLWINMASITIQDIPQEKTVQAQNQFMQQVENKSRMDGAFINGEYYRVDSNETRKGADEKPVSALLQLRERFRKRVQIQFVRRNATFAGFLEFVPWARLLNETGGTIKYVNVTASYIAAGHHLRLFLCYPYFGNHTLEHDPTIGLASAPTIPTLINPITLAILIGATIAIAIAIASIKIRKKTVNIVNVQ